MSWANDKIDLILWSVVCNWYCYTLLLEGMVSTFNDKLHQIMFINGHDKIPLKVYISKKLTVNNSLG